MYKLMPHQERAIEFGSDKNAGLFMDCGTGKTWTAIELIVKHGGKALVLCPLSIIEDAWLSDVKKFRPELSAVSLWHKPGAKKRKYQTKVLEENHDIYVANYETFKTLFKELSEFGFNTLIVDESSCMKNHASQITKAILALSGLNHRTKKSKNFASERIIPHRYVLTGTPSTNSEIEYWSQIKCVTGRGNKVFSDNFYSFRGRYFVDRFASVKGLMAQKWVIRKDQKEVLLQKMREVSLVISKEDALDLPPQTHIVRHVMLSAAEMMAYNKMKNELVLEFADSEALAATALVEIMKLRQITSGFVYDQDGAAQRLGGSKLKELKSLLDEFGDNQCIIWCNFKYEIELLLKELGNEAGAVWGGSEDRDQTIRDFKSGKIKYLIANPMSAAHGLTLTNCSYAVYYSLNYSYELMKQSRDRIHRKGQTKPTFYYYLLGAGTIDDMIYKAVSGKEAAALSGLDYIKGII